MVGIVKAIVNAAGKGTPKPKKFPPGSEFTKTDQETLLQEAQKKVEQIEAKEIKPVDTSGLVKSSEELLISGSKVAPTLTPDNVVNKKVKAPQSSKKKIDEFLSEEEKILNNADLTPVKELDDFNINTFNTAEYSLISSKVIA